MYKLNNMGLMYKRNNKKIKRANIHCPIELMLTLKLPSRREMVDLLRDQNQKILKVLCIWKTIKSNLKHDGRQYENYEGEDHFKCFPIIQSYGMNILTMKCRWPTLLSLLLHDIFIIWEFLFRRENLWMEFFHPLL